jgi:hypothetical protein
MKKLLFIVLISIGLIIMAMSCKTTQDCPAYGQIDKEEPADLSV